MKCCSVNSNVFFNTNMTKQNKPLFGCLDCEPCKASPKASKMKKTGLGLASWIAPGLGQLINDQGKKAAGFFFGNLAAAAVGAGVVYSSIKPSISEVLSDMPSESKKSVLLAEKFTDPMRVKHFASFVKNHKRALKMKALPAVQNECKSLSFKPEFIVALLLSSVLSTLVVRAWSAFDAVKNAKPNQNA